MAEPIPETRRVNPVIFVVIAAVVLLAAVWFFFIRDTGGGTAATTRPRAQAGSTTTRTGAAGAAGPQPTGVSRVTMLDAPFTQGGRLVANIKVGSTVYTVGEGDTFATSYKVVSLDASCGVFLFGDSRFTLCAGQEVLK